MTEYREDDPLRDREKRLQACLPDVESTLEFDDLKAAVTVYRDPWGIPHVHAESEADLFFAQAYVTAQDRLWHMDADRHRALGRWSEFVGERGVAQDRLLRSAGMGRTAMLDLETCSAESRVMLNAYTAGINAYLAGGDPLPIEYQLLGAEPEPWESWHCLAVYKMRNTLLGTFEPKLFRSRLARLIAPEKLARLIPGYPEGHLLTVPPGERSQGGTLDGTATLAASAAALDAVKAVDELLELGAVPADADAGSNAWSISGERTASGLPMVAGDSHRGLDTPSVYYQVHLRCPDFEVIGHSVPGMPGTLHFCHNEHVAWGMTHGAADTQDLFIERFREEGASREYEVRGEWRVAEVCKERLHVKGSRPVEMEVTVTHHGPVIAGDPRAGWGIAICDPGLIEASPWVDAGYEAMKARSVAELHHAFRNWNDRVNNYAVADVDGHFGYLHEGRIPRRGEANGWGVVPGWTGEHEWEGYIPHNQLPAAIDPECGYAVTCNHRVVAADYPHYHGLYYTPEFRARRVQERILELAPGTATVEDMVAIHDERLSIPAQVLVPRLLAAFDGQTEIPEDQRDALNRLRRWNCRVDREAVAPAIYHAVRMAVLLRLAGSVFGAGACHLLGGVPGSEVHQRLLALEMHLALERGVGDDLLPEGKSWDLLLRDGLKEGLRSLRTRLGKDMDEWQWGRLHHTYSRHPLSDSFPAWAQHLDPPAKAVHGDSDTPLAGSITITDQQVNGASVNRYILNPSDWSQSRWIVPLGSSGHAGSQHYADQAQMWADVEYIPMLWNWDDIEIQAEATQRLEPAR
ncbi:MAG: penicillin acylase family protein [Candidatus Latescibacterota bacterium]|nr:penicillin acylase family protein [Candidatus Latescibacterota bacterium]